MRRQNSKRSGGERPRASEGKTVADCDDSCLTEVCSLFALISRGVVSGSDLVRLLSRLAALMGADVAVDPADGEEDAQLLSEGLRVDRGVLWIRISAGLSLRVAARGDGFTGNAIEIARLMALPLSACLASPIALQALRADPGEGLDEALLRLGDYVKLSVRCDILGWSEAGLRRMRNKHQRVAMAEIESALFSAAQAFLRGERIAQRIAPDFLASFAFATPAPEAEDIVIAALLPETARAEHAMDSPAAALLTATEMRIATLLMTGKSEAVIAHQLDISRETVRTHRKHIYQKLGAESRAGLAPLFARAV